MGAGYAASRVVVLASTTATARATATSTEIKTATSAARVFHDLCLGVLW